MPEKILVLGGAGFIGANVTHKLVQEGYKVRVFTRAGRSVKNLAAVLPEIELVYGDYMDEVALRKAMQGIDSVIHLISTTFPGTSSDIGTYDIFSNLIPAIRVLENCLNNGIKKLVYASSGGTIYGESDGIINENNPLEPKSIYGLSKKNIESYLSFFAQNTDLNIQIMRLSNPFGPYQNPYGAQGIIASAFRSILDGTPFRVLGDGQIIRDYIYIDDVVDAVLKALETSESATVNISSGAGKSILTILDSIEQISGKKLIKEFLPARKGDVSKNILDNTKAKALYNWQPKTPFNEGLIKTWKWIEKDVSISK